MTETITGTDLVGWQLTVAAGGALPLSQSEIVSRGHAIEARVYAEDPATGFLPSLGVLRRWQEPNGPGVRVDSGYTQGMEVPPYYDPMLAKVIGSGPDRSAALARLDQALAGFVVLGVQTNIEYLRALLADEAFVAGQLHTGFLAERFTGWKPAQEIPEVVLQALAAAHPLRRVEGVAASAAGGSATGGWHTTDGWRIGA